MEQTEEKSGTVLGTCYFLLVIGCAGIRYLARRLLSRRHQSIINLTSIQAGGHSRVPFFQEATCALGSGEIPVFIRLDDAPEFRPQTRPTNSTHRIAAPYPVSTIHIPSRLTKSSVASFYYRTGITFLSTIHCFLFNQCDHLIFYLSFTLFKQFFSSILPLIITFYDRPLTSDEQLLNCKLNIPSGLVIHLHRSDHGETELSSWQEPPATDFDQG